MATVSPAIHKVFSAFVSERLGLHWGDNDSEVLGYKLLTRAQEAGFTSLLDYYYFLRYDDPDGEELANLAESLVVHESYFFRELEPLEVLVRRFLVPWVAEGRRPRVWSAACAGGEEPLTLAMLLDEAGILGSVEIVASDLSRRILARARSGRYSKRALRRSPPPGSLRYFDIGEDSVQVIQRLVEAVSWRQVNLVDPPAVAALGPFDVVICRNVLIYFDDATCISVVESMGRNLPPGGPLLVGVSESLLRLATSFSCEELDGVFLYRRRP